MIRFSVVCILLALLSACSVYTPKPQRLSHQNIQADSAALPCFPALAELDKLALTHAGTLSGNRIATMPWLRHNRLITHTIATHPEKENIQPLLESMSSLAIQGLSLEWAVVPPEKQQHWQTTYLINTSVNQWIKRCVATHTQAQLTKPQQTLSDLRKIPTDNDYSTLARVAGAYPLATIPFRYNVIKEQKRLEAEWGDINNKHWISYRPPSAFIRSTTRPNTQQALLAQHAPVWLIDSTSKVNRPGTPYWQGELLEVNTQKPTSYAFVSEALWKQETITQLNYIVWFSERPKLKRFDWVAGKHDAVIFRVNLDSSGSVIAYDSIHLCGCWYRLFLPENRPFKAIADYWKEPVTMQRITAAKQMAVYLTADTHQISYLQAVATISHPVDSEQHYQLAPFEDLLQLPSATGVRPVFNTKGYVVGSERPERWLFWPMGVKNPGALRRFGDHAISFVGRRYFDDPHLLEKVSRLSLSF